MEKLDPNNYSYEMQALSCLALIWADLTNTYFIHKIPKRSSASNKYEPEVKAMLSFIHTHYQNPITIKDLLQLTHISRSECFHSFKAFTNMSPIEYINEYRISKAADMLCHTSQNITEIFTSCGFCSSSYFGKLFKMFFLYAVMHLLRINGGTSESKKTTLQILKMELEGLFDIYLIFNISRDTE